MTTSACGCDHNTPHGICRAHGEARVLTTDFRTTCDCPLVVAAPGPGAGVLYEVLVERLRQHDLWGQQNHLDGTGPDLPPPFRGAADQARQLCQLAARMGTVTWRHILLEEVGEAMEAPTVAELREELIQIAAVSAAWVEAIDRRNP